MAAALAALLAAGAAPALAQVKIGATLSTTGPQASLGIPERNTISLLPTEIGGVKVEYVVLDDASDTTRAVSNSHKLISENKVDLIVGSTTTPNTMAMLDTVASGATPVITLASSAPLGVQDSALRFADGRGHRAACGGQRREEAGLHRFQQRAGRNLLGGNREGGQEAWHRGGGQGSLRAHRHVRRGPDPEGDRRGA
jgi:hypothetical protein